ncbi:hypothetical protein PP175_29465 (plasmid) [Aneurinibacillus sp. Ricciae_BoGa-3]|uniref:hypothetical protein n=1 Tax=Aneurinibacillus sp. Ricciae_BoGa-3 TaxID=3022697 RepID=UPI0023423A65|nr:hypothetical protein [Aneurinibacillus sp. Ricciae_BoGa-3]WCK57321.1 hypothetical protein PP175_29465 [Aneurinibacillus sp. Ricciae_BoGa-3]
MNALDWCQNTFKNEESQKKLEKKVQMLLESVLREKDDYAKEKCIKSFSEGLRYLESVLLYQRGVHPEQMNPVEVMQKREYYTKQWEEIESIIESEINRQYNHFVAFM